MGECFASDAEVIFPDGQAAGRDAVVTHLDALRDGFRRRGVVPWHVLNPALIVTESAVTAEVKILYTVFAKAPGEPVRTSSIGHYEDRFVVEDDVWRIRRRVVVPVP